MVIYVAQSYPWLENIHLKRMRIVDSDFELISMSFPSLKEVTLVCCDGFGTSGLAVLVSKCRELGIGIVAYCPLGRGFFSLEPKVVEHLASMKERKIIPKFLPENLEQNIHVFDRVSKERVYFISAHSCLLGFIIEETMFVLSQAQVRSTT